MLRIGIYTRKSIYSDTSDSTDVQYALGAEYCKSHYNDYELYKYEDEGYTGANTDRPDYNRLVANIKDSMLNVVICYKIDRISRNVSDFSNFFTMLSDHNIEFVSIKEQIDTSTPLGRAMMYICSVFAQMERETIAERVTDNMIELAKTGKWTGGKPPLGFKSKQIMIGGKTHTILTENREEIPFFKMITDTFLEGKGYSLSGLATFFRQNKVKTLKGNYLSTTQLYNILKNPHYAPADEKTLAYFKNLGCIIGCEESKFTGKYGIIAYNRTTGGGKKKHTVNPTEKWIISVGLHHPLISSEKWLSIQERFGNNKIDKTRKHKIGILKGVLRCSCGYLMGVQHKVDKIYHKTYNNYFCRKRNLQGAAYCDRGFTRVELLDNTIIELLKNIALDKESINNYIYKEETNTCMRSHSDVHKDIDKTKLKIDNLTSALGSNFDSAAAKYIIVEIEKLDKEITGLKYELMEIEKNNRKHIKINENIEDKYKMICYIVDNLDSANYDEINGLIKDLLKECIWDGVSLKIKL